MKSFHARIALSIQHDKSGQQHLCRMCLHPCVAGSIFAQHPYYVQTQVVQGIKVLGANVRHREKERAERATLVTQERLVKGKVREQALLTVRRPASKRTFQSFRIK